jgi:hypothetical protein
MRLSTGVFAVLAATAQAVDIVVSSSGGNDTTRMPYGLMHEVSLQLEYKTRLHWFSQILGYQQLRRRWHLCRIDQQPRLPG